MKHMPGNGLPEADQNLTTQEHINNVSAARHNANVPMQDLTKLSYHWRMDIQQHYDNLTKRIKNCRQDILADAFGARRDVTEKYCLLPKEPPAQLSADLMDAFKRWAGKFVSKADFRVFLSEISLVHESVLRNKVFGDRKRPGRKHIDKLYGCSLLPSRKTENEKDEEKKAEDKINFYCSFGWYPVIVTVADRRKYLEALFKAKWGSSNWDRAVDYLLLSPSTMDNIRTKKSLHVSTAYRFIIALGNPKDPRQQLELSHHFELHPIIFERNQDLIYGEADGIVMISMNFYDPLLLQMGMGIPKDGSVEFWSTLYTMLKYYDKVFGLSLCGQLFYQENSDLAPVDLPDGKD